MSWADDQAAEYEAAIENAKARIAYGKQFAFREFVKKLSIVRKMLLEEYGTLHDAVDALIDVDEADKPIVRMAQSFGITLLRAALINPKTLRLMAEAFRRLEDTGAMDPRGMAIISAYEDCESFPPTFGEFKRTFIARFGNSRWRADFSMRDTLRFLKLPLGKAKRGRPVGDRSILFVRSSVKKTEIRNRKR